ncbi:MAG: sugar phosphate nucleotidyltransferase, partial [Bacteroidia bacterium]|nr:sugar phosphate nucleotidyltransferase [Bacteroidia bacterium]
HASLFTEQIPQIQPGRLLLEPLQRNTAISILWAIQTIYPLYSDAILWILPADQYIPEEETFIGLVQRLLQECDFREAIFTIGIRPRFAHTGYGYIQYTPIPGRLCQPVKTFTEKPSRELAELFIQSGDFLWNSGIFIASLEVLRNAFMQCAPDLYELFQEVPSNDEDRIRRAFQQATPISFDYAIMEKYQPVMVVQGEFAWWDLGGWNALHELSPHDDNGNTHRAKVLLKEVKDSLFLCTHPKKIIIAEGLQGYLIVDTEDALLILPLQEEATIREWVQRLQTEGKTEYL